MFHPHKLRAVVVLSIVPISLVGPNTAVFGIHIIHHKFFDIRHLIFVIIASQFAMSTGAVHRQYVTLHEGSRTSRNSNSL